MSDADDPFGLMNDAGRTRIRPASSGRGGAAPAPRPREAPQPGWRPPAPADPGPRILRAHPNPLVAAFAPLLEVAPELERASAPGSPEALRVRLLEALIDARDGLVARGVPMARADQAAWFVAALVDDLAINTPWGGNGDWPRQPLVVALVGEVDAGTRFFDRLGELQRFPDRDREMLELAHVCLALGFRGRYRGEGMGGQAALAQARAATARLLRRPDADRLPLSPRWQGVDAPNQRRRLAVPAWAIVLVAAVVALAVHAGLGLQLSARSESLYALARALPPPARAAIFRPTRESGPPPAPGEPIPEPEAPVVLEPLDFALFPLFQAAAPTAVAAALSGEEDVARTVLVVRGADPEVFRSARADLNEGYAPLIESIAAVIVANADVIGRVTVIGHTDADPVSLSNPFGTNQGLSEARAETIRALLAASGVPAELLAAEGRADSEPVGDNATREGRALNRRVEIRIDKRV